MDHPTASKTPVNLWSPGPLVGSGELPNNWPPYSKCHRLVCLRSWINESGIFMDRHSSRNSCMQEEGEEEEAPSEWQRLHQSPPPAAAPAASRQPVHPTTSSHLLARVSPSHSSAARLRSSSALAAPSVTLPMFIWSRWESEAWGRVSDVGDGDEGGRGTRGGGTEWHACTLHRTSGFVARITRRSSSILPTSPPLLPGMADWERPPINQLASSHPLLCTAVRKALQGKKRRRRPAGAAQSWQWRRAGTVSWAGNEGSCTFNLHGSIPHRFPQCTSVQKMTPWRWTKLCRSPRHQWNIGISFNFSTSTTTNTVEGINSGGARVDMSSFESFSSYDQ